MRLIWMVLHFVSLVEAVVQAGQLTLASVHNSESLLAFLIMVVFMLAYLIYKTTSQHCGFRLCFCSLSPATGRPLVLSSCGEGIQRIS
jgi:hypothetical protein